MKQLALMPTDDQSGGLVPADQDVPVIRRRGSNAVVVRPKSIIVNGKTRQIDPVQLMRMIKHVTQTIGEYKKTDNVYADYVITSLRSARNKMVSDLEHHFRIHWGLDGDGNSIFSM